jgi:hypothetical protein
VHDASDAGVLASLDDALRTLYMNPPKRLARQRALKNYSDKVDGGVGALGGLGQGIWIAEAARDDVELVGP